jgi:hypothetical protein
LNQKNKIDKSLFVEAILSVFRGKKCLQLRKKEELKSPSTREKKEEEEIVIRRNSQIWA